MASKQSLWFRLGYAIERARHPTPSAGKKLAGLDARTRPQRRDNDEGRRALLGDDLVSAGIALAAGKLLDRWRPKREARASTLLRAGLAGAGAALLLDLLRPLLHRRRSVGGLDAATGGRLLVGAGQGLLYGAVVEPRIPGPPLLKGALFGAAEYVADPAGGLSHMIGAHVPQARLPFVGSLLDGLDAHERTYLEHLTFGIALAVLYGSSPSSNGILPEEVDE